MDESQSLTVQSNEQLTMESLLNDQSNPVTAFSCSLKSISTVGGLLVTVHIDNVPSLLAQHSFDLSFGANLTDTTEAIC